MTQRFVITKDLDLLEFEADSEWGVPRHKHNFFELTFVLEGSGQHILNESIIDYKKGDLFYLTPKDEHEFVVSSPSKFGLIKFTEQLFLEKLNNIANNNWVKHMETVMHHSNILPESIIVSENDRVQLFRLYQIIKDEIKNSKSSSRNILLELFGAILIIISRNIESTLGDFQKGYISEEEKIESILSYIRNHIQDKEKVKINAIAKEFYISPNYVSIFIKKHTGISIQQYVLQTKVKIAERLLMQTNLTISEIAAKTGFADSSHFNKIFKKYNGVNPSEFSGK